MAIGWAVVSTGRHPDTKMAPAINAARDTKISAVVSRELSRSQDFAAKHGALTAYDDFEAMLLDPEVDVVYLASPNYLHCEQTLKAAAAGKHVLCEKPMALTVNECQRMIDACKTNHVLLGVGFHLRHHPGHRQLSNTIQKGTLGTIALTQAQWAYGNRGQEKPAPRPINSKWWEDPKLVGAGTWMGSGVHCVDLLRYLLGQEVVEVNAITDATVDEPLEHLATVLLRFSRGTLAVVTAGRRIPDSSNDVTVYGSHGWGRVSGSLSVDLQGTLELSSQSVNKHESYGTPNPLALYIEQVEAFNQAVNTGGPPTATGWDGLKVTEVTVAMVESAKTGQSIQLS